MVWTAADLLPVALTEIGYQSAARRLGVSKSTCSKYIRESGLRTLWKVCQEVQLAHPQMSFQDRVVRVMMWGLRAARNDERARDFVLLVDNALDGLPDEPKQKKSSLLS